MTDISLSKLNEAIEVTDMFITSMTDEEDIDLDDDDRELINALGIVLAAAKKHYDISTAINKQYGIEDECLKK